MNRIVEDKGLTTLSRRRLALAVGAVGLVGLAIGISLAQLSGPKGPLGLNLPQPAQNQAEADQSGPPAGGAHSPTPVVVEHIAPTPVRTALATPPPYGSIFGLAWFHKPPQDGTDPARLAAEHRYIHLTGRADLEYRDELRAAGFSLPIYGFVSANGAEGPDPSERSGGCDYQRAPNDNNVAWSTGDFCNFLDPNESWFLHNSKGERLVDNYAGRGRWTYLMNPADPGWQTFSYERLRQVRDKLGYDGIWLDNLDLDLQRLTHGATNSDGRVQEYDTVYAWRQAVRDWLAGLRARVGDTPIWANLIGGGLAAKSWDAYAPYLNGAMDESFAVSWLDDWRDPDEWASQLERANRWMSSGKGLVMVGQGAKDDEQRMRFTLASYMLVASAGGSGYYRYTRYDSFYRELWLYPEYDTARALGAPLGARYEIATGVWRRQFTHGYVEVDASEHTGRLVLDRR